MGRWRVPRANLVLDAKGNLYGTTYSGGRGVDGGNGVVFKLDKAGRERVLYRFPATGAKGIHPHGLVRDAQGNLYGTTLFHGAFGWGTVFQRAPTGKLTVLYNFTGGDADGGDPYAGVVQDSQGTCTGLPALGLSATERCSRYPLDWTGKKAGTRRFRLSS